jgi:pimeloyl-ACP methyl ester carboxylesterase
MEVPETRYARSHDGTSLAYHVVGDGPVDVLWIHSFNGGLELQWEHPLIPALTAKLNTFARVIRHDMRGTGLSDRYTGLPDLETEARDVVAVLDAAGSRSTVVVSAGNVVAPLVAATYPRRVRALCLFDVPARGTVAEGYPWGMPSEDVEAEIDTVRAAWGTDSYAASFLEEVAPSLSGDRALIRWYARLQRHWVAPGDAAELLRRFYQTDIRDVLPAISVPTLCLAREFQEGTEEVKYVAGAIPGATFATLPGSEHCSAAGDEPPLLCVGSSIFSPDAERLYLAEYLGGDETVMASSRSGELKWTWTAPTDSTVGLNIYASLDGSRVLTTAGNSGMATGLAA